MGKIRDELVFKKLTRIMNGPLAKRRVKDSHKLKKKYHNKYTYQQASWNRGEVVKRNDYQLYKSLHMDALEDRNRMTRYLEFDTMDFYSVINAALDIYADEITTCSEMTPLLKIEAKNEYIKEVLQVLFYEVLSIESNLFSWVRNMVKYGDFFLYVELDEREGVVGVSPLPTREVRREEALDPLNPNYVKYIWESGSGKKEFESQQVVHFRVYSDEKYGQYGTSVLEGARRIYRQLVLIEDAMMSYRVTRSAERRVFYLDVGGINHEDIEPFVEQVRTSMRRNQIIDEETSQVNLRYKAFSVDSDYIVPVVGKDSATRIDTLPGGQYTGDIDDVEYLLHKLYVQLKIPQSRLDYSKDGGGSSQGTLSQENMRFARTIQRIQRFVIEGLYRLAETHLILLGFDDEDILDFRLSLNNPSRLAELQELDHLKTRLDVAMTAGLPQDAIYSRRWIFKNILGSSVEEFDRNIREIYTDKRMIAKFGALEEGADASGGGAGEALGDVGFPADEEGLDDNPEPDDSMLIAAPPGRRDSQEERARDYLKNARERRLGIHTTEGSKGKKYQTKKVDNRDLGARKRSERSGYGQQHTGATKRSRIKESPDNTENE